MIKKVLLGIAALIVLLVVCVAILAFVAPTDFRVQREIVINKPNAEVFEYAKYLKNQNDWGPWFKKDPAMEQYFKGTDGTVGFVSHWSSQSDEVGEGEQEIMRIDDGKQIDYQLRFKRPMETSNDAFLIFAPDGADKTKVTWGFAGSMPRPLNAMMLTFDIDKEVGKDFQQGLEHLKRIVEAK